MGVLHGKAGKVKFSSNAVAEITRIRVNESVPVGDTTAMGAAAQTHEVGIPTWTGEVECRYDPADTNGQVAATIGAEVTIGFYVQGDDNGKTYYSGTASIISRGVEGMFDGIPSLSFSVQGNGALSPAVVGG